MSPFKLYRTCPGIVVALLFCASFVHAQRNKAGSFLFQGVVYGYHHNPNRSLLKKTRPFVMEGLLSGVTVNVYDKGRLIFQQITGNNGEIRIAFPVDGIFELELSKEGYETNILQVDTRHLPKPRSGLCVAFTDAEFMLNSYISKKDTADGPIGRLYFDQTGSSFEFVGDPARTKKTDNAVGLIGKAIIKNRTASLPETFASLPSAGFLDTSANLKKLATQFGLLPTGIRNISPEDISARKYEIEKERTQLEDDKRHAVSKKDSIVISAKEAVIRAAEMELQNSLTLIESQKSEIKHKKGELYITLAGLALLAGSLLILFFYYRDKKRTSLLLETQNKNILDGIRYAKRIQQSVLMEEEEIRKDLPDFFVYNQPKDIVSGDFYWFSQIENKLVLAVVDCTGHGVTGAFMSLIANTLLNEIVNEKGITNPSLILKRLHTNVVSILRQEKENNATYDGMDMALCVIDKEKNKVRYAGAINPLYVVYANTIQVIKGDIQSIGGRMPGAANANSIKFRSHTITLKQGMNFYMFSDGFVDQFGGEGRKKFGTERFRQLLLNIHAYDMNSQKEIIQRTMEEWRSGYRQIDDMLVMGVRM